ncbi:MAG: S8 family serine peptidase [Anaerolineae bacterium]|nr:S8 family serine peptidase [Anaerolineae bacterium]
MNCFKLEVDDLIQQKGLTGKGVLVGHLDTGVDATHSALSGRVAEFKRFGYRGITDETMPAWDSGWHGTHTASLITAVAPDVRIYSGMVIEEGHIVSRIIAGLDWLLSCKVKIVLLSLGIFTHSPVFRSLIQEMVQRDILVIGSIGNRGAGQASIPGVYPEVLTIGAADGHGRVPPFSGSYHPDGTEACQKPDIIAPGLDILAAVPGEAWATKSGTSMAAAQVAGLAALLFEAFPTLPAGVLRQALYACSAGVDALQAHRTNRGLARPLAAYHWLETGADAPEFSPPFSSAWELEQRFIDPRLDKQLALVADDDLCEVIVELESWEIKQQVIKMVADSLQSPEIAGQWKEVRARPILILKSPKRIILQLIEWPAVKIVHACDIDKWI